MKSLALNLVVALAICLPLSGNLLAEDNDVGDVPSFSKGKPDGEKSRHKKKKKPRGDKKGKRVSDERRKKAFMALVEYKFPEKAKELKKLREEDPEKFRSEVKKLVQQTRKERIEKQKEFKALLKKYRENPSDELKAQIKDKLAEQFEMRIEIMKKIVAKNSEKKDKMQERLEKRIANKDEIIEDRLRELTKDPALRW